MSVIQPASSPVDGHHDQGLKDRNGKIGHRPQLAIHRVCELEERLQCQSPAIRPGHIGGEMGKCHSIVLGGNCPVVIRRHRCRALSGWRGGGRRYPRRARVLGSRHFCRGTGRGRSGTRCRACDDSRGHATGETEKHQSFHPNQLSSSRSCRGRHPASAGAALAGEPGRLHHSKRMSWFSSSSRQNLDAVDLGVVLDGNELDRDLSVAVGLGGELLGHCLVLHPGGGQDVKVGQHLLSVDTDVEDA